MCTVLLPPAVNPIAVNKLYHIILLSHSFHPLEPYSSVRFVTKIPKIAPGPNHTEHD